MVEHVLPTDGLIANTCLIAEVPPCAAMPSHVAGTEVFVRLVEMGPVSLRRTGWLWRMSQCVSRSQLCATEQLISVVTSVCTSPRQAAIAAANLAN